MAKRIPENLLTFGIPSFDVFYPLSAMKFTFHYYSLRNKEITQVEATILGSQKLFSHQPGKFWEILFSIHVKKGKNSQKQVRFKTISNSNGKNLKFKAKIVKFQIRQHPPTNNISIWHGTVNNSTFIHTMIKFNIGLNLLNQPTVKSLMSRV